MLRTRLIVGTLLALWGLGVLFLDRYFAPWYPISFTFSVAVTFALGYELQHLLPAEVRPRSWPLFGSMLLMVIMNWAGALEWPGSPLAWITGGLLISFLVMFLVEAWCYTVPGHVTMRLALSLFTVTYIGFLGSFLIQLRWYFPGGTHSTGPATLALLLAIFVPKFCDIGAYAAGRLFGKHRMTPLLSPKKTWEGAAGGVLLAALGAWLMVYGFADWFELDTAQQFPLRRNVVLGMPGWWATLLFGVAVGIAGMLGDLMESLIKRDLHQKDASANLPGFGGLLDVFDSILFSVPVTYGILQWVQ
ncbi:MAG TPA: phosphatidate cytidylyltransferase [Gemmatales bacterium]|nr:phosphatidate cytidylyltransferase [Gemmatales bacterium]